MQRFFKNVQFLILVYRLLSQGHEINIEELRIKSEKLRILLQNLGPTYIKLGQMLSVRYDLFHKITCIELQKLLDSGEPIKFSEIKSILKRELPEKYNQLITRMDKEPLAVASIGQVHTSFIENKKVAVKIQKPEIHKHFRRDIKFMRRTILLLSIIPLVRQIQLRQAFGEFEAWTMKELDYSIEATNTEKFKQKFSDDKSILVPEVYREFSTDRVLVTRFIEGESIKFLMDAFQQTKEDKIKNGKFTYSKSKLIDIFARNIFRQIFIEGFVHADPHPSNIRLVDSERIAFIDFGIVANITTEQLTVFKKMSFDLVNKNYESLVEGILLIDEKPGAKDKTLIIEKVKTYLKRFETALPEEYGPTKAFTDLTFVVSKMGVQLPMYLVLLAKVMVTYDGILQIIDPKANVMEIMLPLFEEASIKEKFKDMSPERIRRLFFEKLQEYSELKDVILSLPAESIRLLHDMQLNGIKVNINNSSATPQKDYYEEVKTKVLGLLVLSFMGIFATLKLSIDNNEPLTILFGTSTAIIFLGTLFFIIKD